MPGTGNPEDLRKSNQKAINTLYLASVVSVIFVIVQVAGGYISGSIAILTDSAHLASDLMGFAISIIAMKIAQKDKDDCHTYGFHRAEIVGSLVSLGSLWLMTFLLLGEAVKRCFMPNVVDSNLMLPVAILGLVFNLIQIKILHGDHDHGHAGHDHGHDHGHAGHSHGHDHKQ